MKNKFFEEIYFENKNYIYSFAYKLSNYDKEAAEDLTQETFYQAFISIHRFRGECDIKTWLCQIAKNIFYKKLRKEKVNHLISEGMKMNLLKDGEVFNPESIICNKTIINKLIFEIKKLDKKQKEIMVLRLFSELTFSQIAKATGATEASIKMNYYRTKNYLKTILQEEV